MHEKEKRDPHAQFKREPSWLQRFINGKQKRVAKPTNVRPPSTQVSPDPVRNSMWTALQTGNIDAIRQARMITGVPFNLQKTETLIWVFQNVTYLEDKKRTQYVGGSSGGSLRLGPGIYMRESSTRGERVETIETVHVDIGLLGVTTKHLYFAGGVRGFRIAYRKIAAFDQFSDGIAIHREALTTPRQLFITGDGLFTCKLITTCSWLAT